MSKAWVRDGEGRLSLEMVQKAQNKKPPSDNMPLVERGRNRSNVFSLFKHLFNQIDIIIYLKTVAAIDWTVGR